MAQTDLLHYISQILFDLPQPHTSYGNVVCLIWPWLDFVGIPKNIYITNHNIIYKIIHKMVKLQFINNCQYKITLPKKIVEAMCWKRGDEIKIMINKHGEIVLKR